MKLFTFHISHFTLLLLFAASMLACSSDSDSPAPDPVIPAQRTIIAIFNGNQPHGQSGCLEPSLREDINEIEAGTKGLSPTTNVIVFANLYGQKPYIAEMVDGKRTKVREWSNAVVTTDPDTLLSVMQWIIAKYPANEYALVFGGHGTGSLDKSGNDTIPTTMRPAYAYGWDNNKGVASGRSWINTNTLAAVISHLPRPRYIFFDCCLMQDYDVACQFKKYTDYIIAPVSETPADGAPYRKITPLLTIDDTEKMCDTILTTYYDYYNPHLCISAIRTRDVDDLQVKTNAALQEIKQNTALPYDYTKVIYYFVEANKTLQYDLKSFFYEQNQLGKLSDDKYNAFVTALEKCVFTTRKTKPWKTAAQIDFTDFDVEDYNYGGLSITKETIEK